MQAQILILAVALCAATAPGFADSPLAPYAGQQARTIKSLSDEDIAALLKGDGMGLAKSAELNGYPGPAHVLMFGNDLKLTDTQRRQVQAVFDLMHEKAKSLGAEIVEREQKLDQLFTSGQISKDKLVAATVAIGKLQGQLRSVHLAAHLEIKKLLSQDQIAAYDRVRGYGGMSEPMHHHHD